MLGLGSVPVVALAVAPEAQARSKAAAVVACGIAYLPFSLAGTSAAMILASRSRVAKVGWSVALAGVLLAASRRGLSAGSPGPSRTGDDFAVVSANVLLGRGDAHQIAALAVDADVVAIQENTPAFADELTRLLSPDFAYRAGTSAEGGEGTMIWSRTPLDDVEAGDTGFASVLASTTVRGVRWTVAAVHPLSPVWGSRRWADDARRVLDLVSNHLGENLVVVGDFNAVEEHLTMRRCAAAGLRNAMSGWRSGASAWQPSWPSNKTWVPPVIRIDHALHSESVDAWRPHYVVVAGSDHKALVATFRAR